MSLRVVSAIAVELSYAIFTRTWLRGHLEGAELEVAITTARLATAALYWFLFRDLILGAVPSANVRAPKASLVLCGASIALLVPVLFQGWSPGGGLGTALVFALTSVAVGLREELLYRAVLLALLVPRVGAPAALILSTMLFLIYHYGALPFTPLAITEVVCLSLLLGLIYLSSQSLLAVVAFHSAYDAIWFFGPYVSAPLPDQWRPAFLVPALLLVFLGTWRLGVAQQQVPADVDVPPK